MTPGNRHAKACDPMSIEADAPAASKSEELLPVLGRVVRVEVRATQAAGTKPSGSRASAKTALPCGSTT